MITCIIYLSAEICTQAVADTSTLSKCQQTQNIYYMSITVAAPTSTEYLEAVCCYVRLLSDYFYLETDFCSVICTTTCKLSFGSAESIFIQLVRQLSKSVMWFAFQICVICLCSRNLQKYKKINRLLHFYYYTCYPIR